MLNDKIKKQGRTLDPVQKPQNNQNKKQLKSNQKQIQKQKLIKQVFTSPFDYHIELLNQQDAYNFATLYIQCIKLNPPPTVIIGVKSNFKKIHNKKLTPDLLIIFSNSANYELIEPLLYLSQLNKLNIVILDPQYAGVMVQNQNKKIKLVNALGIYNSSDLQQIKELQDFRNRCKYEIKIGIDLKEYQNLRIVNIYQNIKQ